MAAKRSLYQCFNARVKDKSIYCAKGWPLQSSVGTLRVAKLARGAPLEQSVCQECEDFEPMGESVRKEERGWTGKRKRS